MQAAKEKRDSEAGSRQKKLLLISLGSLVVGSVGYFSVHRDLWLFYLFTHLGSLGVMGLSGSAAGVLARKKRRDFWTAFSLGSLLPIISGIVAVLIFLLPKGGHLYCGGSVSLVVALLVVVLYFLARKKTSPQSGHAG